MDEARFRQIYAFSMLSVTLGWATFAVLITHHAMIEKSGIDILAASGANVLLGAFISQLNDVKQFFFRKAKAE